MGKNKLTSIGLNVPTPKKWGVPIQPCIDIPDIDRGLETHDGQAFCRRYDDLTVAAKSPVKCAVLNVVAANLLFRSDRGQTVLFIIPPLPHHVWGMYIWIDSKSALDLKSSSESASSAPFD